MNIALLQINPVVGDIIGNTKKIAESVIRAASMRADLCVTPELAVCGYPPRDILFQEHFVDGCRDALETLARELQDLPPVLVGVPLRNNTNVGKSCFNGAMLLSNGELTIASHKALLPTYDVFDERRYFEPGTACGKLTVGDVNIGVTVCEDAWNDKMFWQEHRHYDTDPVVELINDGADIIINLSASPFILGKQSIRESMLGSLAARHGVPVLYTNQVGGNDDLIFAGKSLAFAKDGTLVGKAKSFEEDILLVNPFERTGIIHEDDLNDESQAWRALTLGTRDYVRKCGFSKVVLGLSGGIDSALTAAIAVDALGPENVFGVLMPSPYSSQGSVDDSLDLAARLGIQTETISIAPMMNAFDKALASVFAGADKDVTEENLQSRIRGNLLMAMSNKLGAMLLTTGNKSEVSVGYCTIYGDMAGGLAVIADVPKTLVWSMSRWVNRRGKEIIPTAIIDKVPSAELRPDQKDTDSLPEYEDLDAILNAHIVERKGRNSIIGMGYNVADVDRVLHLVKVAEFKRRQAAPGLKITDRAFGTGWRMPVAANVTIPEQ